MDISKHSFLNNELDNFILNFHSLEIKTEPIANLLVACAHIDDNPLLEYYKNEYFSSEIYYNYVSSSSIITDSFLKSHFGEQHFTFLARIKHNNYILDYGNSQFLISANSKELISNTVSIENIEENPSIIKDIIGFSLKFQQKLTFYGLSADSPPRFKNFFKRMISHPEIHKIITTNYDLEMKKY